MPHNDVRRQVGAAFEEFWRAGLYDPTEIMEQLLYMLFLQRLDDLQVRHQLTLRQGRRGIDRSNVPADEQLLRWSGFKHLRQDEMFAVLADQVFPRLRQIGGPGSAYAQHMKDARFSIPSAAALAKVVALLDAMPRPAGPDSADPYTYLSGKLAMAGPRGAAYTPRHIVRLMVALVAPRPVDIVCSPVGGNGSFLVAVAEYLAQRHPTLFDDPAASEHFHHRMFHAYDVDKTMLRIACMSMALMGVSNPGIRYTNSIAPDIGGDEDRYSVVLAHPSTACLPRGSDSSSAAQAEIVMVAQFLRLLKPGGRAAVIVSQHILSGISPAHLALRKTLVDEQRLDAVIAFPGGLCETYSGDAKAILLCTRTDCGGGDHVWFCDVQSDNWSAETMFRAQLRHAKRTAALSAASAVARKARGAGFAQGVLRRRRKAKSLLVRKDEIADASHCLSVGRYRAPVQALP